MDSIFTEKPDGVVGKPIVRVDGRDKVTGRAKYSAEYPLPGLTYAVFVTSPIAKGKVVSIDSAVAMREPGVLQVLTHQNLPPLATTPNTPEGKKKIGAPMGFLPMTGDEIFYAAQPVAIVVADTLEHAMHAATLVKVAYQSGGKPIAYYTDAKAELFDPQKVQDGKQEGHTQRGNPQQAFASAPIQLTDTYYHPVHNHNPMEPGSTTAQWTAPDRLTVYESTQGVFRTQSSLKAMLGLPADNIRVITKYLGGGFGCKGSTWPHTILTIQAAKAVNRPVKLMLTRPQMFTSMGHREDQEQTVKLGATAEGKITSIIHTKKSTTSPWDNYAEPNSKILDMLYATPNFEASYEMARANVMTSTFMRAPGEAPGSFALECSMDDLAYRVGVDPMQIRMLNHADYDYSTGQQWSSKSLKQCYQRGAELIGWSKRNPKAGQTREGRMLVGIGMATASYPVHNSQGTARARLYADGHALVQAGATDLGTGTYTVMTQVAADSLGLPLEKVRFELGDTQLPNAPNSGGSVAAGTVSSSIFLACQDVWDKLIKMAVADRKSPLHGADPADVSVEKGRLFLKSKPKKGESYAEVLHRADMPDIEGMAQGKYGAGNEAPQAAKNADPTKKDEAGHHSMHSFGAHFCEVHVDPELGVVRVSKWVSVISVGRVLNSQTARSQVLGGAIFGIGSALMEATERDDHFARYTNADLANYHVPVNKDIPDMTVEFVEEHDPYINAMGVKGIGEIGIVGVAAAVANAVYHATGKRLRHLPMTPDKVLMAGPLA